MDNSPTFGINYGKVISKYNFKVIDENDNIVQDVTYTNMAFPERYFSQNCYDFKLSLGIMLPSDYRRYQEDGKWKPGYAYEDLGNGATRTNDHGTNNANVNDTIHSTQIIDGKEIDIDTGEPKWKFNFQIRNTDTGLFGTAVYSVPYKWVCKSAGGGNAHFQGTVDIGYHDPKSSVNTEKSTTKKDTTLIDSGPAGSINLTADGEMVGWNKRKDVTEVEYGIHFTDGCIFNYQGGPCISHFTASGLFKRPTDKIHCTLDVIFTDLQINFGTNFIPEGNTLYGNSLLGRHGGISYLRPNEIGFSSREIKTINSQCGGGCAPINPVLSIYADKGAVTDCPNDWDAEKMGEWRGYPKYNWFGSGNVYLMKEVKTETGQIDKNGKPIYIKQLVYALNDKDQRKFNFSQLKESNVVNFNSYNIGPIRSVILKGTAARSANGVIPIKVSEINEDEEITTTDDMQKATHVLIGYGDGVRTKFYHGITSDVGRVSNVIAEGDSNATFKAVTYYSPSSNAFAKDMVGIYNDDFQMLCSNSQKNTVTSSNGGWDKEKKACYLGLHPFTLDYYPGFYGVLGVGNWLVYQMTGSLKSAWIGGHSHGHGAYRTHSSATILTSDSINGLKNHPKSLYISATGGDHAESNFDFQCEGYVAIQNTGGGWNGWGEGVGPYYVGGFSYAEYDPVSVRISTSETIEGYVEFDTPPAENIPIYMDVEFRVPFIYNFTKITGKFYNTYGDDSLNGKVQTVGS